MIKIKKIIFVLSSIILIAICGCSIQDNQNGTNIKQLESQLSEANDKVDDYERYYSKNIRTAIDKYCENYLSYDGKLNIKNVSQLKSYLTDSYYKSLKVKPYNEGNNNQSFIQSTAVNELFYEDLSKKVSNSSVRVAALCSQSSIAEDKTDSYDTVYLFTFSKIDNNWKINNVENISS